MGAFMGDCTNQCALAITPAGALDAGPHRGARIAAVATNQEAAAQGLAGIQRRGHRSGTEFLRHDLVLGDPADQRILCQRRDQCTAQKPVFDHMPHRAFLDLGMVEFQHHRRWAFTGAPVADLDLQNRLGLCGDQRPDPKRLQQPLRGHRQGITATVEIGGGPGIGRQWIDDGDADADTGQGQSHRRPVQPATGNQNIRIRCHVFQYEPTSGIVHAPRRR